MKKTKLILALIILICFSATCYGDSFKTESKLKEIHLTDSKPESISAKVNKNKTFVPSSYFEAAQNPFLNGMIGGYSNLIQGITGNSLNLQEQQKQQLEYTKQQMENMGNTENVEDFKD